MTDSFALSPAVLAQLGLGVATVIALTALLLGLGRVAARSCPGEGARLAALGVAGAYAAIGLGVVLVTAAAVEAFGDPFTPRALAPAGLSMIALGVGFSIAAATLRNLIETAARLASRLTQTADNAP